MNRSTPRGALRLAAALFAGALLASGCGDDPCNDLFGSAGQGASLAFETVRIRWIADESLVVSYVAASGDSHAVFSANLRGLAPAAGLDVDLAEPVDQGGGAGSVARGNVERAANDGTDFGRMTGGSLRLDEWSGAGGEAQGSFHAVFEDGRSLNGDFCGTVEAPVLP